MNRTPENAENCPDRLTPEQAIEMAVKAGFKAGVHHSGEQERQSKNVLRALKGDALVVKAVRVCHELDDLIRNLEKAKNRRGVSDKMLKAAWLSVSAALREGVRAMNTHAAKNPRLFGFAAKACYWPVIKSPGLGFVEEEQNEKWLFAQLKIGTEAELKVVGSKWKANDKVGELAVHLLKRVINGRLFEDPLDDDDPADDRKAAQEFRNRVSKLPPLKKRGAWKKYWVLAEEILLRLWQDPVQRQRLSLLVTAQSKQQSPGRMKAYLFSTLKERFASMAGQWDA
ncbi:MAG TPA: hypothetical protein P5186_16260 [Candidatus Paceibacterota bacterium]|nr:hypothetical protein [Candidatus Paceibacterota bacterium]